MHLFTFGKLFCDLFLLLFVSFFTSSMREERQAREDVWSEYETWNCVVHKEQESS